MVGSFVGLLVVAKVVLDATLLGVKGKNKSIETQENIFELQNARNPENADDQ